MLSKRCLLAIVVILTTSSRIPAGLIIAETVASPAQGNPGDHERYEGDAAGMPSFYVASSDPPDVNRYAQAHLTSDSLYAYTRAAQSGIFYPSAYALLLGLEIRFANDQALQDLISANGGQPLDLFAKFSAEFQLQITQDPSGVFNQTATSSSIELTANSLTRSDLRGVASATNGPYDYFVLGSSGFLSTNQINAGRFALDVPFRISSAETAANFIMRVDSSTLSLSLPVSSSAELWLPSMGDVFLATGQSARSAGLTFEISPSPSPSAVPEPGTLTLAGLGVFGLIGSRLRKWRYRIPR